MKIVLVTGAGGFIGKNLVAALRRRDDVVLNTFYSTDGRSVFESALRKVDIVYHLAGVNRPETEEEFETGNVGLTREITEFLKKIDRKPLIILSSSTQAALDNPYGRSKKAAENALLDFNRRTGAPVGVYRLPNVFGKWSRPSYNTVVATFCYNTSRGIDISISDPKREIELVYIDDVVEEFLRHLAVEPDPARQWFSVARIFRITLGELADRIHRLRDIRETLVVPDLADDFMKCLHATYLSFIPENDFVHSIKLNTDNRGWLFELIKSEHFGQIFISKTLPGITRGNHYHDTKVEKFCVIQGKGIIRFRHVHSGKILEYSVSGGEIKVVDIPPGYAHSIENIGTEEMVVLFWANQIFDPRKPDTYFSEVLV